jgi:hypothetical protein
MRILFILFLTAALSGGYTIVRLAMISPEERALLAAQSMEEVKQPPPALLAVLEREALEAKRARWVSAAVSGAATGVLIGLFVFLTPAVFRKWRRPRTESPCLPNLDPLLANLKLNRSNLPHPITHFYDSRRARCRAARTRLKATLERLFGPAPTTGSNDSRRENPFQQNV